MKYILTLFIFIFFSCNGEVLESLDSGNEGFCPTSRMEDGSCPKGETANIVRGWSFNDSSLYTYNSGELEVANGSVKIRKLATDFTGSEFLRGEFYGGNLSSSNNLTISTSNSDSIRADKVLSQYSENFLGYWRLENNGKDSSGREVHLEATGGVGYSCSDYIQGNYSFQTFSSGGLRTEEGGKINQQDIKTISLWIKKLGDGHNSHVFGVPFRIGGTWNKDVLQLRVNNGSPGSVSFQISKPSADTNISAQGTDMIYDNRWYHVVALVKESSIEIYINGEFVAKNTSLSELPLNTSAAIKIGHADLGNSTFNGNIDEVFLLNKALSPAEIKKLYQVQGKNFNEFSEAWTPGFDDLVGYWSLNHNWSDKSKYENHGAPVNTPVLADKSIAGTGAGSFDDDTAFQYVSIPNSPSLENVQESSFSLQAWYYPKKLPSNTVTRNQQHGIIMKSGFHAGLSYDGVGKFRFLLWDSSGVNHGVVTPRSYSVNLYHHVLGTVDYEKNEIAIFVNGEKVASRDITGFIIREYGTSKFLIGAGGTGTSDSVAGHFSNGYIDEVAIWKKALTETEVLRIYEFQKQRAVSEYVSPVIDLGQTETISELKLNSTLPLGKEISTDLESSSDYVKIEGNLSDGLEAYYPVHAQSFNGSSGELKDLSGNGHHGYLSDSGAATKASVGILGKSIPIGRHFKIPVSDAPTIADEFTFSFWMKAPDEIPSAYHGIFIKGEPSDNLRYLKIQARNYDKRIGLRLDVNGTGQKQLASTSNVFDGKFHHIVFKCSNSLVSVYVDGKFENSMGIAIKDGEAIDDPTSAFGIGTTAASLNLDEIAIWSRALSDTEISELHNRSATQVKTQLRVCHNSTCTSATGWKGPGGDSSTHFSEIFNRSSSDIQNILQACDGDSVCSHNELIYMGSTNGQSSNFILDDFLTNNYSSLESRYFQFRTRIETTCEKCAPEVSRLQLTTTGNYFSNLAVISAKKPIQIRREIRKLSHSLDGQCQVKYQFSKDGVNFYYFDGESWVLGSNSLNQSNEIKLASRELKKFVTSGDLYFKALLKSNGESTCELKDLKITQ